MTGPVGRSNRQLSLRGERVGAEITTRGSFVV